MTFLAKMERSRRLQWGVMIQTLLVVVVMLLTYSCSGDDDGRIPLKGEVTYELMLSDDITSSTEFGSFLPHTVKGVYDTSNVKLMVSAPMGLVNVSFVLGEKEDFVAVDFDEAKLLLTMAEFFNQDEAMTIAENLTVTEEPELVNISGYMSRHVSVTPSIEDQSNSRIDVFFVPFTGRDISNLSAVDLFKEKLAHKKSSPGVVTAVNIRMGDSNIMMVAKKIRPLDGITKKDFQRPPGFIRANHKDLLSMMDIVLN